MSRDESRRSKRCRADRDFEMGPGSAIMVNDYDDERTLDEEEALECSEDTHNELSHLQKEKDMPLKELLVMYNYGDMSCQEANKAEDEDNEDEDDEEEEEDDEDEDDDDATNYEPDLKQFYTEMVKAEENGPSVKRPSTKASDIASSGELDVPKINAHTSSIIIDPKIEDNNAAQSSGTSGNCQNVGSSVDIGSGLENVNNPSIVAVTGNIVSGGSSGGGSSRLLRSVSRPQSEEEEDDCDYSPDEEEWKKTIMVGSDYQAAIPEGLCKYDDALPYENEDKMLWDPCHINEDKVEEFLERAQLPVVKGTSLPSGNHIRDDEQTLYLLLQCGYNLEEALRRRRMNMLPSTESVSLWSEEECHNFETGLRNYGKDFHLIQKNKVRTRSVGELVQFYYLWKKTERHDIFTYKARLEKKKYALHPGITDYMDRFLEEQEGVRDRSSSPNVHCLLYGDTKRQRANATLASNDESNSKSTLDPWDNSTSTTSAITTTTTTTTSNSSGLNDVTPVNSGPTDPLALEHCHNSSPSPITAPAIDYAKAVISVGVEASLPVPMTWSSTTTTSTTCTSSLSSTPSSSTTTPQPQQSNHLHHHLQQQQSTGVSSNNTSSRSTDESMTTSRSSENILLPRLPP